MHATMTAPLRLPTDRLRNPNADLTPADERWLTDNAAQLDTLAPEELGALCQRFLRTEGLCVLSGEEQSHLLCCGVATGVIPPNDQEVCRFFKNHGVPSPSDRTFIPAPITWTLRGLLSSPFTLSLDSPEVHIFLVEQGEKVVEVLVVGRGVGEMRRRLYDAAFLAALAVPRYSGMVPQEELDRLQEEARRMEERGDTEKAHQIERYRRILQDFEPAEVLDGLIWLSRNAVNPATGVLLAGAGAYTDMDDPFDEMVREIRRLAETSGLVHLHTLTPKNAQEFHPSLQEGVFFDKHNDQDRSVVASAGPIFGDRHGEIGKVEFLMPWMPFGQSPLFKRIEHTLVMSRAERTLADAEDRLRFHRAQCSKYKRQLEEYEALSCEDKKERDKETFQLSQRVDHETVTKVTLRKPTTRTGIVYYNEILPDLLKQGTWWEKRTSRIRDNVELAKKDGRLKRLAIGFLVDRAMRDLSPLPGDPLVPGQEDWQKQVRPLLLHSWVSRLRESGVQDPAQYATRRLFFRTTFRGGALAVTPHYLFVNSTSVLDSRGAVQRLIDRIDRLVTDTPDDGKKAETACKRLKAALKPSGTLKPLQREAAFRDSFYYDPEQTARRLVRHLVELREEQVARSDEENPMISRHVLALVASLTCVGAYHAAMRHVLHVLEPALEDEQHAALGLTANKLPEIPCLFLLLVAMVDPSPTGSWDLVEQWYDRWRKRRKRGNNAALSERVRKAIVLAESWEPGYLGSCLRGGGKNRRVRESDARKKAEKAKSAPAAIPALLEQGRDAMRAAFALMQARDFPRSRTPTRRMYRHIGNALAWVMASNNGAFADEDVQELSDLLLGAELDLNEETRRLGRPGGDF
jgi:hypothetical protein